ncbi:MULTISPECIES: hypothetical protein [Chryseobacterium]|uniref:Type II toxin-antitoxin system RelE/ParE family toxin n=1 Tax=Chryseobacterium camelliae TaxID=1265445 RepID=A0ABU0TK65_9FLAO|nr:MULTISPECIES: hypothetical protein [Chryseobacterium]MDT3408709.1 hypothetical protein [Pseudacidovorax intermedius]MDQ1097438.1 hypothetical protein [Chryseobacterium camelliae]MDQ1101366.1 hypothetical protein [Chryseobacterium sp. SORGH_AS_1048]MDR6084811.1 hypothetical protein [Chryseobacterium sp. SORGH_AS_0909]MDR6129158.1 hypothetical protein [Chryseobacterium sp. SORGH_AS_1175]
MKVLLSSIAKNDIRLLMRVFNAEKEHHGSDFLEELKESISCLVQNASSHTQNYQEISTVSMQRFPVKVHYIVEDENHMLITAIFKI